MALRIELTGQVGLRADARVIPTDRLRRPAWVVLAYLAAERHRPVRRDELAEILWGDDPPDSWDAIVRGLISKLRSALVEAGASRDTLTTAFGCYQLQLTSDTVIDAEEAAADLALAERALAAGEAERARAAAVRAAEVTARQFLPGAQGAWVERRQAELAELRLRSLEATAQASSGCGEHAAAVQAAEDVVELAPLRESGHLRLISALAGGGNRAEALRAYERCRRILADELGASPSAAVEAAYLGLLDEDAVVAPRPRTIDPLPAALAAKHLPLFVGREHERDKLGRAWERAVAGQRQTAFLGGEPGIGKTRLVAEFARQAHAMGGRVLYGRCDEEFAAPYEPLADIVRQCLSNASAEDLAARLHIHADELTRLAPEFALRLPHVPRPAPDNPALARALLAEAVDALLGVTASAAPLLVVLDDLHWAGEPAIGVLRRLIRSSPQTPVVFVVMYRDTDLRPDHPLASLLADTRRDAGVTRLRLGGIATDDVVSLMEAYADAALGAEGQALGEALRAHTRGNPFFVGEVLRHLTTSFALDGGRLPELAEVLAAVPEGVREVVTRRLLRLSAPTNRVLAEAAVVGAEFEVAFLEEMGTDRDVVLDAVDEAVASGLVVETASAGRYGFAHALVRHTIYDELGAVRRARLHRRTGQTLEHLHGRQGRHIAMLAHHFCAGSPAGDAAVAADYSLAAAQAAAEQLATEDAIVHLRAGLAAFDAARPDVERRWQLLMVLALACERIDDDDGWRQACQAAADLAREQGWVQRLAQVAAVRALTRAYDWLDPPGAELCEEVLAAIGDGEPGLRALLLCSLLVLQRDCPTADRDATIRVALKLARQSGAPEVVSRALVAWCLHLKVRARHEDYVELRRAAEELLSLRLPPIPAHDPVAWWLGMRRKISVGRGWHHRAEAYVALGERENLEADLDGLERSGTTYGDPWCKLMAAAGRDLIALADGRYDEVERFCDQACSSFPLGVGRGATEIAVQHLFRLRYEQDRLADALTDLVATVERYPTHRLRCLLALAWIETGRPELAQRKLAALLDPADVAPFWAPSWLLPLAEVSARLDEVPVAAALYEQLLPHAKVFCFGTRVWLHLGPVDHFLGMLAATLGRWKNAENHFAEALALEAAMGSRALRAHTLYWRAWMLERRRAPHDEEEARRLLREVTATTATLGMAGLDRHVEELLVALGHHRVYSAFTGPS